MILPITLPGLATDTTAPSVVSVSRAPWVRAADGLQYTVSGPRRLWRAWQASRRRAMEFRALRELSPNVLRDIGISPEIVGEVQAWSDRQSLLRDSVGRGA
jgi:uncharacterized protein YjiS (DUF1127 family)